MGVKPSLQKHLGSFWWESQVFGVSGVVVRVSDTKQAAVWYSELLEYLGSGVNNSRYSCDVVFTMKTPHCPFIAAIKRCFCVTE